MKKNKQGHISDKQRKVNGKFILIKDKCAYIDNKKLDIPNILIEDFIGSGANGIVLRATEKKSGQERALKIWLPNKKCGKSNITRSTEEIKKISNLDNKYIVKYYYSGEICGYNYCLLENIDGMTIKKYINDKKPSLAIRYYLLKKILSGLRNAHENYIYHGDLHDENIIVKNNGEIKILDFGTSVFCKEKSIIRDSRLMYSTSLEILGEYIDKKIFLLDEKETQNLSPIIVRLIIKAASKITVLLDFCQSGVTESAMEDIVLYSFIVPFFNLKYIEEKIIQFSDENSKQKNIEFFKYRLIMEGSKRITAYPFDREYKDDKLMQMINSSEISEKDLYQFYKIIRDKFVELCTKTSAEKNIYLNTKEAEIFNGLLYMNEDELLLQKDDLVNEKALKIIERNDKGIDKILESI